jgi:hypothetical protein
MTQETDLIAGSANKAPDPVAELVGEGKKYKDVAALAVSRVEADRFIEQLKTENSQLRGELDKAAKGGLPEANVQALIERIEKATQGQNPGQTGTTLTKDEIEKLVKDGITTERSEASRRANYTKSNAELLNHFKGNADQASKHLKDRMAALGMTGEALTEIASNNPRMFQALMIPQTRAQDHTVSLPPGKTGALPEAGAEKRGKSYYTTLRKELGNKFWDPALQQQMFRDRKALGSEFNAN